MALKGCCHNDEALGGFQAPPVAAPYLVASKQRYGRWGAKRKTVGLKSCMYMPFYLGGSGCPLTAATVANVGLVWYPLLKISCHPGGDWNPGQRDNPTFNSQNSSCLLYLDLKVRLFGLFCKKLGGSSPNASLSRVEFFLFFCSLLFVCQPGLLFSQFIPDPPKKCDAIKTTKKCPVLRYFTCPKNQQGPCNGGVSLKLYSKGVFGSSK